ncbi:hypothetical protein EJB05_28059, partial [Eragrostis curvula]
LITLWASSSPSLLAFCFSHIIIAVLFIGGSGSASDVHSRGECAAEAGEAETLNAVQLESRDTNSGGREDSAVVTNLGDRSCASSNADGLAVAEAGEAGAGATLQRGVEMNGAGEGASAKAGTLQERCGAQEEEDELMVRAEEFIQRMNRVWRTENVRAC